MFRLVTLILCATLLVTGCEQGEDSATPAAASDADAAIYTATYPAHYFTQRIVGDVMPVRLPVPADADPIFWSPPREMIAEFQNAAAIVLNGAEFEQWPATASLPEQRVIRSADGIRGELISYESVSHSHGPAGEHTHEGVDGHTWIDPINATDQAQEITRRLAIMFPQHGEIFKTNLGALSGNLRELHGALAQVTPSVKESNILASHPAYNYLARRYEWKIKNFDLDPQSMPDEVALEAIAERAKNGRTTIMLWESEPTPEIVDALKKRGVTSVVFSPAETRGEGEPDYLETMRANIQRIAEAVKE